MLLLRRMNMGEKLIGQLIRGNVEDKWEKIGRNLGSRSWEKPSSDCHLCNLEQPNYNACIFASATLLLDHCVTSSPSAEGYIQQQLPSMASKSLYYTNAFCFNSPAAAGDSHDISIATCHPVRQSEKPLQSSALTLLSLSTLASSASPASSPPCLRSLLASGVRNFTPPSHSSSRVY